MDAAIFLPQQSQGHAQPLALRVQETWIAPKPCKVGRHGDEPITDRFVESELIILSPALPVLLRLGQCAQLIVPFALKRIGAFASAR